MTEQHQDQAAAAESNTHKPAAAAAPCGCEDQLVKYRSELDALGRALKVIGYLAIIAAGAVLYVLWSDIARGGQEGGGG